MKKTVSLLIMLMLALQSLIAAADVHHVLEPAIPMQGVHHHEHRSTQQDTHKKDLSEALGSSLDSHACCHAHAPALPFLTVNNQRFAGDTAARLLFPARHLLFSSWISAPDLRPPIV